MTPADPLRSSLESVGRPLRVVSLMARAAVGGAAAVAVLAVAAWLERSGWIAVPELVLATWIVVGIVVVACAWHLRAANRRFGAATIGRELEGLGQWRQGSLTTPLEQPLLGTSAALHRIARQRQAAAVQLCGPTLLAARAQRQRRSGVYAFGAAAVGLVALVAARPAAGRSAMIWQPIDAIRALLSPVRLTALSDSVDEGEPAVLQLHVVGYPSATLYLRSPGETWHSQRVMLNDDAAGGGGGRGGREGGGSTRCHRTVACRTRRAPRGRRA